MNILSQSKVLKHRQKTLSAIELVSRTTENGKGKHHALCYDNDDADIDNDDVLLWAKLLMNLTKPTKWVGGASKDSDQPGHLPSLIRVFAVRSMGS